MSARTPFVPQRPVSRASEGGTDSAATKTTVYEPFRPTGLLDPASGDSQIGDGSENGHQYAKNPSDSGSNGFASKFKPLNLSGFSKQKSDAHPPGITGKSRQSLDGSLSTIRAPKPFAAGHQARLNDNNRPVSPFFPSSRAVSAHHFRAPTAPPQITRTDDFSSNSAHIASSRDPPGFHDSTEVLHSSSGPVQDRYRPSHALDNSFSSTRSRTASQPSLASIHEVAEEDEPVNEERPSTTGPPIATSYSGSLVQDRVAPEGFEDAPQSRQGLRRPIKRHDREEEGEDEYQYGTGAKRYKPDADYKDEYSTIYNGPAVRTHLSSHETARAMTPAHDSFLPPLMQNYHESTNASNDLDIFVEANANSYESARKKWAECSVEEWTKGADDIAMHFGKMLDYVKDHMTSKLALYVDLHADMDAHKKILSEREQTLKTARENLVREGGAVVSSVPQVTAVEEPGAES
ncbi:hypothetical protein BN946_scf184346.g4 [Trametes cinnabarina]|uniref:Extracellular mutant protein 11 C-terminal domain-containing protein n=1 Tax=Pycnoporus cinnabarinus TaxID=5643 RepID=A0A060STT5_PYCCI|nr:hypothetical protein BN946_scf184346.g4 [Trametes cinnabarina]